MGCWAHARGNFVNVIKAKKKNRSKQIQPKSLADEALEFIGRLYQIEKKVNVKNFEPIQIYRLRQEKAKPVLEAFKTWLITKQQITPPKRLLGKAVNYTLNHWKKLIEYIEDGRLSPDNNAAENTIRPFVLVEKTGYLPVIRMAQKPVRHFTAWLKKPRQMAWTPTNICDTSLKNFLLPRPIRTIETSYHSSWTERPSFCALCYRCCS